MVANIDDRNIKVGAVATVASSKKQPDDTFIYTFDFTDWLETTATTLASFTSAVSPAGPVLTNLTVTTTKAPVKIAGGTTATKYVITVKGVTADGQTKETELSLTVLAI